MCASSSVHLCALAADVWGFIFPLAMAAHWGGNKKTPLFIPFGFPKKSNSFFPSSLKPPQQQHPPTTTTTTLHPLLPAASYHAALFPWQQELIWRSCRGRWRSRVFVFTHVCVSAHTRTDSPYTHGVTKEENDYPYLSLCSLRDGFYSLCVHPSLCRSVCLSVLDQSQVPCLKRL